MGCDGWMDGWIVVDTRQALTQEVCDREDVEPQVMVLVAVVLDIWAQIETPWDLSSWFWRD
jgi:hypothetical protein